MARTATVGSPGLMRQLNLSSVLTVIRTKGPLPRPELASITGLSMPTVKQIVELLLAQGYVEEVDPPSDDDRPRRPGPRARYLSFRATIGYVLAVDAGAYNTVVKIADLSGSVISTARYVYQALADRHAVLNAIRTSVAEVLRNSGLQRSDVRAMVIGTPGVVDPHTGQISLAPQIADWDGVILRVELADLVDCQIVVENETHLSLLAEQWIGAASHHLNVVYVQLGIGIGAAILIDGRLYRGSSGAAGEIAYLVTDADVDQPRESAAGPFEWFAGGDAFRRRGAMAAIGERGGHLLSLAGGDPAAVTARVVFDAAAAGDAAALDVAKTILERLGREVANIASILNPELILLGGGLANAGDGVLVPIQEAVGRFAPRPPAVQLSELGGDGTVLGAIRRAIDIADQATFSFIATTEQQN
jgi:predicted NBD/HSP70 family sugar kinase